MDQAASLGALGSAVVMSLADSLLLPYEGRWMYVPQLGQCEELPGCE